MHLKSGMNSRGLSHVQHLADWKYRFGRNLYLSGLCLMATYGDELKQILWDSRAGWVYHSLLSLSFSFTLTGDGSGLPPETNA